MNETGKKVINKINQYEYVFVHKCTYVQTCYVGGLML